MASRSFYTFLGILAFVQTLTEACDQYDDSCDSSGTWTMWYIWMSVVMTTVCCCGVVGFYCRYQARMKANRRRVPMFHPYPPTGVITEPGIYYPPLPPPTPVTPPAYETVQPSGVDPGLPVTQPGQAAGTAGSSPPSYSEIFGPTSSRHKNKSSTINRP